MLDSKRDDRGKMIKFISACERDECLENCAYRECCDIRPKKFKEMG